MKLSAYVTMLAVVVAGFSVGAGAFARPAGHGRDGARSAHEIGPLGRPAIRGIDGPNGCGTLPGDATTGPNTPASNMRYWCTRCVIQSGQHYHPDCPENARCSPNNGVPQCGGGHF